MDLVHCNALFKVSGDFKLFDKSEGEGVIVGKFCEHQRAEFEAPQRGAKV